MDACGHAWGFDGLLYDGMAGGTGGWQQLVGFGGQTMGE